MIQIQRINTGDKEYYDFMEKLLVTAFPSDEYRDLNELRDFTDNKENFHLNIILDDDKPIGFVSYWDFDTFHYVEHFAIDPKLRNGGYGRKMLELLAKEIPTSIVLEVEASEDEMALRRIGFYKRQGYVLWEKDYIQPSYKQGADPLPMYIMALGDLDCERNYEQVKNKLHKEVYGV